MFTQSHNMEKPEKVEMIFESMHLDNDKGETEKPQFIHDSKHLKNKNSFKGVTVTTIDITENMKNLRKYDPTQTRSEKALVGPLPPSQKKKPWYDDFEGPIMCCYKLSKTRFDIMFGGTLEKKFSKQQEFTFKKFHKMIYCLMDEWWDMSLEEVLKFEAEVNEELGVNLHRDDIEMAGGGFGGDDDSGDGKTNKSSRADNLSANKADVSQVSSAAAKEPAKLNDTPPPPSPSPPPPFTPKIAEPEAEQDAVRTPQQKLSDDKTDRTYLTPDEELPPKCPVCPVRHRVGDPHEKLPNT
ncbi:phosphatidylinositol transfer protein 1-like [Convolutriloba macropyga]|uniref:phosphatidylinositol transfer protein 1-like n=1 Tax=Convolutriloba macropyga TaxID=536237 RepID=UPI003F51B67C